MIILVKTKHLYRGMAWLSFQKSSFKLEQNLTGGDCLSFVLFCFSLQYLVCTLCVSILCFFLLNQSSSGWKTTGPRLGVQVRSHQVRPEQEHHSQLQHRPYRQVGTIYFFDCCSSSTWNGHSAANQPSHPLSNFCLPACLLTTVVKPVSNRSCFICGAVGAKCYKMAIS